MGRIVKKETEDMKFLIIIAIALIGLTLGKPSPAYWDKGTKANGITGSYTYVDPSGALITVNYIVDDNGFSESHVSLPDSAGIPKKEQWVEERQLGPSGIVGLSGHGILGGHS